MTYTGEAKYDNNYKSDYKPAASYKAETYKAPSYNKEDSYKADPYKAEPYKADTYKPAPYKAEPYKADPYKPAPYKAEPAYKAEPYKSDYKHAPAAYNAPAYWVWRSSWICAWITSAGGLCNLKIHLMKVCRDVNEEWFLVTTYLYVLSFIFVQVPIVPQNVFDN